jgi:cytochrome P450
LDLSVSYSRSVFMTGVAIHMVPGTLQPLLAPLISVPKSYLISRLRHVLRPEIERRQRLFERNGDDAATNDFLQWQMAHVRGIGDVAEYAPDVLADRVAAMNFAAVDTSTAAAANAIFDILSSPEKDSIFSQIREELSQVREADGGVWTKTSVQRMVKTDAIQRESMRLSGFFSSSLNRVVMAKEGITTPDGLHIRQGNTVAIAAALTHRSPEHYSDPDTFVPLRFLGSSNLVDTSVTFLGFSHGRHACPGRFFAANMLKLFLAHMTTHYDVQPLPERPEPLSVWSFLVANPFVKIRVKRRET